MTGYLLKEDKGFQSLNDLFTNRIPLKEKSTVRYRAAVGELAELIGANDKRSLGKMLSRIKGKDIYAVLSEVKDLVRTGKKGTGIHAFNNITYRVK